MRKLHVAACCGLLLAAPAAAQNGEQQAPAQVVSTRGLDLGTAQGQKELDRRIHVASREVCGVASSADALGHKKARACRADAVRSATANRKARLARALALAKAPTPVLLKK